MSYTLKLTDSNTPFFLEENGVDVTLRATNNIIEFNTVNELARSLVNNEFNIANILLSDMRVSETSFVALNNLEHIESISTIQDYSDDLKLICSDDTKMFNIVASRRQARIYLKDTKMELTDPKIELLQTIKIDNETAKHINVNDTLILCSDYSGRIHFKSEKFKVLGKADSEALYDNRGLDVDNYTYFSVLIS